MRHIVQYLTLAADNRSREADYVWEICLTPGSRALAYELLAVTGVEVWRTRGQK